MYYVKHERSAGQRRIRRISVILPAVMLVALFLILNIQLRRIIADSAQIQAQNIFSVAVSEAMNELTAESSFDMVRVNSDENGQVVSIETNTAQINAIKSQVSITLINKLGEMTAHPVKVSLGTLTGIDAFAGLGPQIEMRFELRGGVSTDIVSELQETGINQSLHTIDCVVSAEYSVILPGFRFAADLSSTVPLAQSVIVGEVPDAYTYVIGDQSDTVGRIFDYGQLEP